MRVKKLKIAGSVLNFILTDYNKEWSPHFKTEGVPTNARVMSLNVVNEPWDGACLEILLSSDSFDEVEEGDDIPEISMMVHSFHCKEVNQAVSL